MKRLPSESLEGSTDLYNALFVYEGSLEKGTWRLEKRLQAVLSYSSLE
jgi:hypothetical protein